MKTRIERLEHSRIHVQTPPSRTAHLVGNAMLEQSDEAKGEYVVSSTVIMVEHRDEQQRVFAGRQHHRLRRDGASFRIVEKRVDLINCDSAFEAMALPIWFTADWSPPAPSRAVPSARSRLRRIW